jgi:hypothetical protein
MNVVECHTHGEHGRAHADWNVRRAAHLLATYRNQRLLSIAVLQMHVEQAPPRPMKVLVRNVVRDPTEESAAIDILASAFAIATCPDPEPSLLRGAFLERLVTELLEQRSMSVRLEMAFAFAAGQSMCVDVLGESTGQDNEWYEAYEAKTSPWHLTQYQLDQLAWIRDEAEADRFPQEVVGAVATLNTRESLAAAMDEQHLTVSDPLYRATLENILGLAIGRPTDRLT